MKKQYLEVGKVVGTHGVRGGLRVQPWADNWEFLAGFRTFYADPEGTRRLTALQVTGNGRIVLMKIKGIDTVEAAEQLRGKVLYIDRKDVKLPEGRYFISDLIGCKVFHAQDGRKLGTLTDVSETGANDVWHVTDGEKEYLVPAIDEVIVRVDIDAETVVLNPMKGIFEDED